jgi:hypothetical protein
MWEQSLALSRATGNQIRAAESLLELSRVAHRAGDDVRARGLVVECLELYRVHGHRSGIAHGLACLAGVAVATEPCPHGARRAARLFGAADALHAAYADLDRPHVHADHQRDMRSARAQLDAATWEVGWTEGRAMPLEHALAYAIDDLPTRAE